MGPLDNQIRHQLNAVLDGTRSLDDFEEWFVGATVVDEGAASNLVSDLDHLFAERSFLSDDQVRDRLVQLASTIVDSEKAASIWSSAAATTVHGRIDAIQNVTYHGDLIAVGKRS